MNKLQTIKEESEVKKRLIDAFTKHGNKHNFVLKGRLWGRGWRVLKKTADTSEKGWDLIMRRKNVVLLIEAKVAEGQRAAPFESGMAAVLMRDKPEKVNGKKLKAKHFRYCFAINKGKYRGNEGYFDDYIRKRINETSRGNKWWKLLKKVGAKYVFIIDDEKRVIDCRHWNDFF